ncbi:hypothetical protein [Steroidobacter agaridevorans]|uniref:hypothetical protein n=1 Tax=Steroidobacter agaridevorans TaxID=2695856 RepID=UPI001325A874|nr:hypothetical protein [Steroidobacter agaridevorans]GFE87966.1 hypothetical protein GCM10011488_29200 [Steroidobacter agaridevorans]
MSLSIAISNQLVGPRAAVKPDADVWFAMQIAAGLDQEPAAGTVEAAAKACLPWNIIRSNPPVLRAFLIFPKVPNPQTVAVKTTPAAPSAGVFDTELLDAIHNGALELLKLPKLLFSWQGGDSESTTDEPRWAPIMQSLAALSPPLNGICRAGWYAQIAGSDLYDASGKLHKAVVLIVPETIHDQQLGQDLTLVSPVVPNDWEIGAPLELSYESGGAVLATLRTPGVELARLAVSSTYGLDDYWLAVTDVRGNSIADVDRKVDRSLDPELRIESIDVAELQSALKLVSPHPPTEVVHRMPVLAQQLRAFAVERAQLDNVLDPDPTQNEYLRRERVKLILDALMDLPAGADPLQKLRESLLERGRAWMVAMCGIGTVALRVSGHLAHDETLEFDDTVLMPLLHEFIAQMLPAEEQPPKPLLPGEKIDFSVGNKAQRLVHEDHDDVISGDAALVAEVGVLVRRSRVDKALKDIPWQLLTAGVPVLDKLGVLSRRPWGAEKGEPTLPHPDLAIPCGLTAAFVEGLLRQDYEYGGTALIAGSALNFVHRQSAAEEQLLDANASRLAPLSFQSTIVLRDASPPVDIAYTLAPPLRYGDLYEFAAFVIDRVGGLPTELSVANAPWQFDRAKLAATLSAPGAQKIEFKRRVPVGEINVMPGKRGVDNGRKASWPAMPSSVSLRVRDWLVRNDGAEGTATVLFGTTKMHGVQRAYSFSVEPPRLDEHTLLRWVMPKRGSADEQNEAERLRKELARIFKDRDALLSAAEADLDSDAGQLQAIELAAGLLPHDPAVAGIAARVIYVDDKDAQTSSPWRLLGLTPESAGSFICQPLQIQCYASDHGPLPPKDLDVAIPEGWFACIELRPAVDKSTFDERMDADALKGLYEPAVIAGKSLVLFGATRIALEHATARLPDAKSLYDAIGLTLDPQGAVQVKMDASKLADWKFVDRYTLMRDRWVWRNLPLRDPDAPLPGAGEPLAPQLPAALADPAIRDSDIWVLRFDALASIDRGFVDRGQVSGSAPRVETLAAGGAVLIHTDTRDAVTAADYLRFGLTVHSRYAGVLPVSEASRDAISDGDPDYEARTGKRWRRIVADFRGDPNDIKALKVLSVLPLTKQPRLDPRTGKPTAPDASKATPFLVVLDESWYREYGQGECLQARIVLETREIGEGEAGDKKDRPFRAGPIPDHWVSPANSGELPYYGGKKSTDEIEKQKPSYLLDCYGPFGFSFDRSGNEALATATAFVVYVPKDVGPYWSVFVQFRRLLRGLRTPAVAGGPLFDEHAGPWSDTHPLYTLPDSSTLAYTLKPDVSGEPGTLELAPDGAGKFALRKLNLAMHLRPFDAATGRDPHAEVVQQYVYVLLIGPLVADGGRALEILLPSHALWLDGSVATVLKDNLSPPRGRWAGRVLEIKLNGRYPAGTAPLQQAASLKNLFDRLLKRQDDPKQPHDAQGMVTRMSAQFEVRVS